MKVFKNHIKLLFTGILILCLCGCYNLGDFEDEQNYFDTFEEVILISSDKKSDSYSTEDYFYTEEGINDFVCDVPSGEYIYAAIKAGKDISLDDLSLSFCSEYTGNLYISVFLAESIPLTIRGYDDEEVDKDGNSIPYDDPLTAVGTCVVPLEASEWRTTMVLDFSRNNYLSVIEGQYILIRFENNSWIGKQNGYSKMDFMLTNLLICAQRS